MVDGDRPESEDVEMGWVGQFHQGPTLYCGEVSYAASTRSRSNARSASMRTRGSWSLNSPDKAEMAATALAPCRRRAPAALRRVTGSVSCNFSMSLRISGSGVAGMVEFMSSIWWGKWGGTGDEGPVGLLALGLRRNGDRHLA